MLGGRAPWKVCTGLPLCFPFFDLGPPGAAGFPSFEEGDFLFGVGSGSLRSHAAKFELKWVNLRI
jgi:hypothetical protein